MIITKTPFRVSFCGGGSDLKTFYQQHEGCVLSTTINKYLYLSIHPYFDENQTLLKYSANELVASPKEIQHKIFRDVLTDYDVNGVEIVSTADIPAGTGLGSSSTFTVGLLHTMNCYKGKYVSKGWLAKKACQVEIEHLDSPIGKQDQYAAAYGGLNFIRFHQDDTVSVEPIIMRPDTYSELQNRLVMFYTGIKHDANQILSVQKQNISKKDKFDNLVKMTDLARDMKSALEGNDLSAFGKLMDENWQLKKSLAQGVSNSFIDDIYDNAMHHGALGGKLLGAGGGGFLLFYTREGCQEELKQAIGLRPFDFRFERDGTSIVYVGDKYWN